MTGTRIIYHESPEEYIWSQYLFLENEKTAHQFLKEKYANSAISHPEHIAYKNVQAFNDYVKQARAIFTSLRHDSLWVQPLLLYYGMMALLKAYVLTKDIHYPENTSVLRHGISTRRKKRAQFRFFQDDIRIQRDGLFPHVANILHFPITRGDSYKAECLLSTIPELKEGFEKIFHTRSLLPITVGEACEERGTRIDIPSDVLDLFHNTPSTFVEKLNRVTPAPYFSICDSHFNKDSLTLLWKHPKTGVIAQSSCGFDHPWLYEDTKGNFYLWMGKNRYDNTLPEVLAHYMLVFALSMICRYETTLWGEIVYGSTSEDAILITQLLTLVRRKFPHLILNLLHHERLIVFTH